MFIDQPREILGRRVLADHPERLSQVPKMGNRGVAFAKNHSMIELRVDPKTKRSLDIRKVDQHPALVEPIAFQHDDGLAVMPVQMSALSGVIEEPVAVAEIDLLADAIHTGAKLDGNRAERNSVEFAGDLQVSAKFHHSCRMILGRPPPRNKRTEFRPRAGSGTQQTRL